MSMSDTRSTGRYLSQVRACLCGMTHDPTRSPCRGGSAYAAVTVTSCIPANPPITERAQALLTGNMRRYAILITDEQLAPALDAFQRHRHLGDATALREALIVLLEEGP